MSNPPSAANLPPGALLAHPALPLIGGDPIHRSRRRTMNTTITEAKDRCETCFGKGTLLTMKSQRWGTPIDHSQPACPTCKGTGRKPDVR